MNLFIPFISLKISLPYYIDKIFTFECLIEGPWIFIFYWRISLNIYIYIKCWEWHWFYILLILDYFFIFLKYLSYSWSSDKVTPNLLDKTEAISNLKHCTLAPPDSVFLRIREKKFKQLSNSELITVSLSHNSFRFSLPLGLPIPQLLWVLLLTWASETLNYWKYVPLRVYEPLGWCLASHLLRQEFGSPAPFPRTERISDLSLLFLRFLQNEDNARTKLEITTLIGFPLSCLFFFGSCFPKESLVHSLLLRFHSQGTWSEIKANYNTHHFVS